MPSNRLSTTQEFQIAKWLEHGYASYSASGIHPKLIGVEMAERFSIPFVPSEGQIRGIAKRFFKFDFGYLKTDAATITLRAVNRRLEEVSNELKIHKEEIRKLWN